MSVSPLLLCKQIFQYHFSRFHIYALEYDIYLFLTYVTQYTDFRFIHLIRTDSKAFFFMGECVAERSYPASEARGGTQKEPPRVRGQGWQAGGATLHPRPGAVAERINAMSKERWLPGRRRA